VTPLPRNRAFLRQRHAGQRTGCPRAYSCCCQCPQMALVLMVEDLYLAIDYLAFDKRYAWLTKSHLSCRVTTSADAELLWRRHLEETTEPHRDARLAGHRRCCLRRRARKRSKRM